MYFRFEPRVRVVFRNHGKSAAIPRVLRFGFTFRQKCYYVGTRYFNAAQSLFPNNCYLEPTSVLVLYTANTHNHITLRLEDTSAPN